ncbi:uncharacterized protein [Apostichopus japonicus]|uniref:uncharacterized protein isoform X5 n=1 Tax=Stichopus japonicus TaxID=307972 RepID=UPI003AB13191
MDIRKRPIITPVQRTQLPRFTAEGRQACVLSDMTVDSSRVAVSGYNDNTRTTFIDLFALNIPDSSSPFITRFYSKEFKNHSRWRRYVSFLDDSRIVTVCGDQLDVFNIKTDDIPTYSDQLRDEPASCMTVREGGIFIGLSRSNEVIVFDFSLNKIKTITLEGLVGDYPVDITVCGDNLFISTFHGRAIRYNMEGVMLLEYNTSGYSRTNSITVSSEFGLVFVPCWSSFPVAATVFVYSLTENHTLLNFRVIIEFVPRIRINDVNRFMFTTTDEGILNAYSTASIFTFSHLKEELSLKLTQTDLGNLGRYFSLPPDQVQTIITSPLHSKNFLLALEERGYIHPSNVNRLTGALTELKINHTHLLTETYMKLRDQETEYDRFLAGLSAHLTFSITVKLCDNFEVTNENKNSVISNQNPGLSFLLTIDEMGIINPSDVSKLETPLEEYRLLQAVAKIHEYQSLVLSDEIKAQDEDKESLFLKCLQQKMKSWFETMTPVPWMKSCQWKSNDLFIASRLVLTNSGSNISSREVDRKCKLHYLDIFTDERLKAETRIILEGQPGSGKTMLSSQLAYDWCCGKLMDIPMVIYLPLKIVDDMTIIQAIKMFYIRKCIPITEENIESMLNSGKKKVYLILDGLEEYNGVTKDGSPSEVMRVMSKEKLSNCIVIITARTDYTKHLPPGPMLKIGSFGEDERNEYIEKVFSDDQTRQEDVKDLIDNVPFILDLCYVPLLFVLLVHNIDRLGKLQEGQLDRVTPFVKAIVDILCSVQDEEGTSGHLSHQQLESICDEDESRSESAAFNKQEEYEVTGAKTAPEAQSSGHHKHDSTLKKDATIKFDPDSFAYHAQEDDVSFVSSGSEKDEESTSDTEETSWSLDESTSEEYESISESETSMDLQDTYITLEELAFNGLCKGNQQLFWQKDFVDRCVSNSKTWIDAGLLVVEEGTPFNSPSRDFQTDSGSESPKTDSISDESLNTSNVTSEIKRLVSLDPDLSESINQSKNKPILESKEKKSEPLQKGKAVKDVSLQAKFLHKLIQEWFAAKYLARLFWGHKSTEQLYKYQLFREHLANIDPADLHYILRFTCHICPPSFHVIASFLMRDFKTENGEIPDYIMNCICLCFAEYDGYKGHKVKDIVKDICKRESVNFSSEDSRLLLRSKVSMLTFSTRSQIPIKCLKLSDVVEKITEKALILKTDVSLRVLNTLKAIEVNRWDQKLIEQDYEDLIKFITNNEKVEVARLLFPSPPVAVKDEKVLKNLKSRNISVEWIIGANLIHTLNVTTGEWMMEFRLPGRMSANSDNLPSNPLQIELWVNKDGGELELPDTGVSLEIPPGALEKDQLIQMRIIPYNFQGDPDLSFTSNSSVVVELLPNNLKLLKPVELTLPHCLVLKKGCEWKAKIYSSHHEEGNQPVWRPQPDTPYVLTERSCVIKLKNFSWEKFDIGDEIVEGKRIVLYAAKDLSSSGGITHIQVGYYLELPGGEKIVSINEVSVLVKQSAVFFKQGKLPLTCHFVNIEPPDWTCGAEGKKTKEISFLRVATSEGSFCKFVLNIKEGTQEKHKYTCHVEAGQGSELVELVFILKDGEEESAASSSNKVVDAGLSQSQKKTGDESLTVKQPLENIDLEVRTESLRNPSLPSHQAISGEAEGNLAGAEATTIDREEVTNETLQDLSGNLFKEWRDVGRNLKLAETELDNIEADNRRKGQKEVVYHMLLLWKRKHGMKATNTTLRDALIAANGKDLSNYLLNREQCGTTSDSNVKTALSVQAMVDKEGRILEIPGTGVRLDIPPGAIDRKCLIKMKIIPNYVQEESKSSFTSNTTVVVELLPDNLKLHHPAKLTLPHCLKLKNPVECKAMVFSSHHDQGTQPKWRPKQNALYQLNETNCIIWVESFSWETCQIDDRDIEFKWIQVYAACSQLPVDPRADCLHMELGYYIDLPGKKEIIEKNDMKIVQEKPFPFFKEGQLPLKILLEKIQPESWKCTEDTNPKELSFRKIAMPLEYSRPFCFDKVREEDCTFYFKATQEETIELRVPYKMDIRIPGRMSAKSSSLKPISEATNTTVEQQEDKGNDVRSKTNDVSASSLSGNPVPTQSADAAHSRERRYNESTAVVLDVSASSLSGNPVPSQSADAAHSRERRYNESTAVVMDVSASSLSGNPVPSQSADAAHSRKRRYNESTAVVMDVSASSPSNSPVSSQSADVPHSKKRCYNESTAVVMDVSASSLSGNPVPSQSADAAHSRERRYNESTAVVLDVSASSLSGNPVPSQSADAAHSRKRRYNESTAVVMDVSASSPSNSPVSSQSADVPHSKKRCYNESTAVVMGVSTESLLERSVPSKSGNVPHSEKRCIDESTAEVIDVPLMRKINSSGTVHEEQGSLIGTEATNTTVEQQEDKSNDVPSKRNMEFRLPGRMSANSSSLKPISDNLPSNPLQMELLINKDGGVLELPDTGVSLEIPPGALEKDQLIQMRIIPYNFQGDSDLSFSSNSSVVVELLPSNLKLLKPVKLTLPHCLVLKKGCEWNAQIYSSHHEEGTQPLWRPQPDTPYELTERNCVIKLKNFSWEKFDIGDEIVEGKHIVLYAAKDLSSTESITQIHVGYYLELPGGEKIVSINEVSVLVKQSAVFFKQGKLPLTCHFVSIEPPDWSCCEKGNKTKEISFKRVATSRGGFCTFVLNIKEGIQERHNCKCHFEAGQGADLVELRFILKAGVEDSAASSSDKLVAAGISQSQKKTGDESLTVKQSMENIDLEVRTESLRDISSSHSGNPAPSQSADVPHSKKRGFNESTAVMMDISPSSLSGSPAPSQSADVPHSKKRRYNESTAVVMAGVEDSAASSSNKVVDAGISQSQKKTGDESLTVKQPMENIDPEVRTECLRDLSGNIPKEWKRVGRNLGLKDKKLCIIETDYNKQGHEETVYQMLLTWKHSNGSKATYRVLGEALIAAGRRDQQEMLYKRAGIKQES